MPNLLGKIGWLIRQLGRGMNADLRPDKMEDGLHRDAFNFRMGSVLGNSSDLESVGGSEVLYPPQEDEELVASSYACIGMIQAGSDTVSFHASDIDFPRIKVNGITMVYSAGVPYQKNIPLQLKVLDRRQGAIIFPADGESPALFWDIEAIKAANLAGEQTYTTQFDVRSVSVVPAGPTEWPEHTGNPEIGIPAAKPGQYVFRLRFYDRSGNRSNFGPPTPHITVAGFQAPIYIPESPLDAQYPGGQTAGSAPAGADITTPFGIALKWQIDNQFDNAGIELVVTKFINGEGLNGPGETEVVARIPMVSGQFIEDFPFIYPRDNNFFEAISIDEAQQQFVNFTAPKTVEVIDNRVVYANIRLKNEVVQLTFRDNNGEKTFPFTDRVFTRYSNTDYDDGFADPVNNTYMKSALHGERYSMGLMLWDGTASRSAVVNIQENVLFPERARRKEGDPLTYSSDPIYRTNTECQGDDPVSATFDAIVQGTRRKYNDSLTNVVPGLTVDYNPFRPSGPADPNFVRYREKPIEQWRINATDYLDDAGFVFSTQFHSLGLGIYGPDNLEEQAPWCEVFSVMRTAPANRVIASGMAVYYQPSASAEPNRKSANQLRAYFPDMDSQVVPLAVQEDIQNNPQNYRVKFTPYGFYNETYSYRRRPFPFIGTDCIDMITYMDMQNDTGTGTATSVNVGEPPSNMAIQPGVSAPFSRTNNIGYPAWRRLTSDIPAPSAGNPLVFMDTDNVTEQGAVEVGITNFSPLTVGRGSYHLLQTDQGVYSAPDDLTAGPDFSDAATRRYNGPVWIIDILRSDAAVPTLNVQEYVHTGTHIATNRTIGIFQGGTPQIELFHARPYDAIPRFAGVDIRYAYVLSAAVERRWMHIDSNTGGVSIADIVADINANGFWVDPDGQQVFGLYSSHEDINSAPHPIWFLDFSAIPDMAPPPVGSRIIVKYDKREPILAHGFDCTIAPTTWAPLDFTNDNPYPTTAPMPYAAGIRAANYLLPRSPTTSADLEQNEFTNIKNVRQWVVYGSVVARTPQWMNKEGDAAVVRYSFPRTHYVIRPTIPVDFVSGASNGLFLEYDSTYPGEAQYFMYGGTWFDSLYNLDYSKQPIVSGVGVPLNGQNPVTDLPTGHIASLPYNPLSLDSPGFRTFTFDNLFVVDEATGEVKMIAVLDQGGRQAMWGWTQNGYYYIPYNAQMLTDADGNVVATQSVGTFWPRRENWVARGDHGMPDEFCRMAVKANVPMGSQNVDTVVWADRLSVYMLSGATAVDIAANKIRSILLPILSTTDGDGRPGLNAVYDKAHQEVWISTLNARDTNMASQRLFVFDMTRKEWVGEFGYRHEQYLNLNNQMLGATHLTIYEVDKQNAVDADPVNCYFTVPFFMDYQLRKEAMRWRVVGDMPPNFISDPNYTAFKPSSIEVYDAEMNLLSQMDGTQYALFAKNYDGFEGWVNRVLGTINTNRPLPQSQGFFLRVRYDTFGQKVVASVGMQLKHIK